MDDTIRLACFDFFSRIEVKKERGQKRSQNTPADLFSHETMIIRKATKRKKTKQKTCCCVLLLIDTSHLLGDHPVGYENILYFYILIVVVCESMLQLLVSYSVCYQ